MGRGIRPCPDPGEDPPVSQDIAELVAAIDAVSEHPVDLVLLAAVLLRLIEEQAKCPVGLPGFTGDLQPRTWLVSTSITSLLRISGVNFERDP